MAMLSLAVEGYETYAIASVASVTATDCVVTFTSIDGAGVVYARVINREQYGTIRIFRIIIEVASVIAIRTASVVRRTDIIRIIKVIFCVVIGTRDCVVTRPVLR
jgi:hypothetical protein